MIRWICAAVLGALFVMTAPSAMVGAETLIPAERRVSPYTGELPSCDDPGVLSRIQNRFRQKESEYWSSALEIVSYDRIGQIGYRSNGLQYIPRRFCRARAYVNDNRRREVVYAIGENLGIIGYGYGVEWCVIGLDRNDAYSPACRAAYP